MHHLGDCLSLMGGLYIAVAHQFGQFGLKKLDDQVNTTVAAHVLPAPVDDLYAARPWRRWKGTRWMLIDVTKQ